MQHWGIYKCLSNQWQAASIKNIMSIVSVRADAMGKKGRRINVPLEDS